MLDGVSTLGKSILLSATTIGTPAALAWAMASTVWGITPSSAATTSTTISVTLAPRARIEVNASWPGVSTKVIGRPLDSTWYAPMCWVMPPLSESTTLDLRIRSSSEVLPWSTWPKIVMTGGRGRRFSDVPEDANESSRSSSAVRVVNDLELDAELEREHGRHVIVE